MSEGGTVAEAGGRARGGQADLRDPEAAGALMAQAQEYLGGLDVLVNNAGLDFTSGLIADTEAEVFDVVMGVNPRSAFLTMRHAARTMRDGGMG